MSVRRYRPLCDPRWKRISASLRKDPNGVPNIYLKLPATKLGEIILGITFALNPTGTAALLTADVEYLRGLLDFLKQELAASGAPSIFLRIPVEEIERNLQSLKVILGLSKSSSLGEFITAVEAGLRNNPDVDWIARCGGPTDDVSANACRNCGPKT